MMPNRSPTKVVPAKGSAGLAKAETVHSSLYLHPAVYDALREIAYNERLKIHDLVVEGIDAMLRKRGYPSVAALKGGKGR